MLGALYDGVTGEAAALPTTARLGFLQESITNEGWVFADSDIGDFGTDYLLRAEVAIVGIGANTPEEAVYPAALADSDGNLLNGANDYGSRSRPARLPPAKYFWSLTVYDFNGYLTANPIDRYSIGPSHPPLSEQPDGSIAVALSRRGTVHRRRQLAAGAERGFRLNMRLYGPRRRPERALDAAPGREGSVAARETGRGRDPAGRRSRRAEPCESRSYPAPSRAARSGGSCRSGSSAARRRTRPCGDRRRR